LFVLVLLFSRFLTNLRSFLVLLFIFFQSPTAVFFFLRKYFDFFSLFSKLLSLFFF
ncbi:unnamed protein product, partial [Sphagnum jensenii]